MSTENQTPEIETEPEYAGRATYCPEDNNLRLYIGRVPRDEYLKLKSEGWRALYKQREAGQGDFVATWTPERRATALAYAGLIEDEDAGPEERAADRAERFGGYLEKRLGEAEERADKYDSQPAAHGFQDKGRAARAADRHDRLGARAVDAWDKAEYWERRTAGVIAHRLYLSSPAVRMGRIKELESLIRKSEASRAQYEGTRNLWLKCQAMEDTAKRDDLAKRLAYVEHGDYTHPRTGKKSYLYDLAEAREGRNDDPLNGLELCELYLSRHGELAPEGPWLLHFRHRLAYENQMLEAQGGRAAHVEMEAGGWLLGGRRVSDEWRQIQKVNKSPKTGRVVSVIVRDNRPSTVNHYGNPYPDGVTRVLSHTVETERMNADVYRAPTDEERAAFADKRKAEKKAIKAATIPCPLINPTFADAARLQELWNEEEPDVKYRQKVILMTQAQYSAHSAGSYSRFSTVVVCETGREHRTRYGSKLTRHDCFKVRQTYGEGNRTHLPRRVIVLTDAPQKPIPWAAVEKARAACPSEESMWDNLPAIGAELRKPWMERDFSGQMFRDAEYVGWLNISSQSQVEWTAKGVQAWKDWEAEDKVAVVAACSPVVERSLPVSITAPRVQSEFILA